MIRLNLGPENLFFEFDISSYDDIALLFSGGADSTLLLYLLLLENKEYQKQITSYVIDRYNNPIEKSKQIYKVLSDKFNLNDELKILLLPNLDPTIEVITGGNILSKTHSIIMTGVNKYPSDKSIRPKYEAKFLRDNIKDNGKFKFPLKYLEKYHIIDAFYKLGIQEFLPYTHSCGSANMLPCGECFNCKERIWAYNILNINYDLGS
jgi:7-cyano-7-deazaguanine synthase in queuosine biosynthesis